MDDIIEELHELLGEAYSVLDAFNHMGDARKNRDYEEAAIELKDHLRNLRWGLAELERKLRTAQH